MLSNYIKKLLDTHTRVIIPDMGAFILKGDSSQTIYFNEFLRFNDGLLVDYIAEQENIDKIESAKKIKSFVDDTNKQLLDKKTVELKGLGTLFVDANDKVQLKSSEYVPSVQETVTPAKEAPVLPKTEPAPHTVKVEPEKPMAVKANPVAEPAPKLKAKEVSQQSVPVPEEKKEPARPLRAKEPPPPVVKKEVIEIVPTTNRKMIFIAIIGILVVGAIVYYAFFRPVNKTAQTNQNITIGAKQKSDSLAAKDTTVHAAPTVAKKSKVKPAKVQKVAAVSKSGQKKYFLIGGCFVVEGNADRMVNRFKNEGYQPEKIAGPNNMFYVSYSSFNDKASASQEIQRMHGLGTMEVWIFAY